MHQDFNQCNSFDQLGLMQQFLIDSWTFVFDFFQLRFVVFMRMRTESDILTIEVKPG